MMRVVVDTNVLISAALKAQTAPRQTIRWIQQHGIFLKSSATEDELLRTLAKPKLLSLLVDRAFIQGLTDLVRAAELVPIVDEIRACRDPHDNKFLELALNGRADVIVSGDDDLLVMHPFQGIPILTAASFLSG
jgi:uncharacterized protein